MKAETFILISNEIKANVISRLMEIPVDGKTKVVISDVGSKSERQRGLDWKWDGEIHKSGIGWADDTVEITHARGKWMFAKPILLRNDEVFSAIYDHFIETYGHDAEMCLEFANDYILTQKMSVADAAEYLTNKQYYWLNRGVILTNPDDFGLEL